MCSPSCDDAEVVVRAAESFGIVETVLWRRGTVVQHGRHQVGCDRFRRRNGRNGVRLRQEGKFDKAVHSDSFRGGPVGARCC